MAVFCTKADSFIFLPTTARYKTQPLQFKKKVVFMHNEALAYSAKKTVTFLDKILDKGARLIKWPANCMDLNPIEYSWAITKRREHTNGR